MYEVKDTGLPPPRTNESKYPWKALDKPGKSFLVPLNDPAYERIRNTVKNRMLRYPNERYACRVSYDERGKRRGMLVTRLPSQA